MKISTSIFGLLSLVILSSCNPTANFQTQSSITTEGDVAQEAPAPTVVVDINAPVEITPFNELSYTISGTCTEDTNAVNININSGSLSATPTCTTQAWTTTLDVSSLGYGAVTIRANHSDGAGANAIQKTETVNKRELDPNEINNLISWFDGADSSTIFSNIACTTPIVNTQVIGCWKDKSATAGSATGASGPIFNTNLLNSKSGVTFTGGGTKFLTLSAIPNTVRTVFIVYNDSSTSSYVVPISENGTGTVYHGHVDNTSLVSPSFTDAAYRNANWFKNGNAITSTTSPRPGNTHAIYSIVIGSNINSPEVIGRDRNFVARGITGDILELLIYNVSLSNTNRTIVERYLKTKWGI